MKTENDKLVEKMQKLLLDRGVFHSCLNCESWWAGPNTERIVNKEISDKMKPPCCLKFDALPPPDVIFYGCDSWEVIIPF